MNIPSIKRPWIPDSKYGERLKRDPFYQSPLWKATRRSFRMGVTIVDGFALSNVYCVECYKRTGKQIDGPHCDHIVAIEDGGSRTDHSNLQSLCTRHHNRKSAIEGNKRRKK